MTDEGSSSSPGPGLKSLPEVSFVSIYCSSAQDRTVDISGQLSQQQQ